jgi:hypothetical protein
MSVSLLGGGDTSREATSVRPNTTCHGRFRLRAVLRDEAPRRAGSSPTSRPRCPAPETLQRDIDWAVARLDAIAEAED